MVAHDSSALVFLLLSVPGIFSLPPSEAEGRERDGAQ
jgi:hypothetical protein